MISGSTAYIAAEGNGGGCFDGDFAVSLGSTDQLLWQNDCLGATQALEVVNGFLFKGSHAHDCAYAPGGFPQVNRPSGGWVTWHLLDQSAHRRHARALDARHQHGHHPSGIGGLGPHAMATDGSQLFLGGDFTTVNGKPQQGFAIFPAGQDPQYPGEADDRADGDQHLGRASTRSASPPSCSRDVGTLELQDLPRRRHHPDRHPDRHVLAVGPARSCTTRTPA